MRIVNTFLPKIIFRSFGYHIFQARTEKKGQTSVVNNKDESWDCLFQSYDKIPTGEFDEYQINIFFFIAHFKTAFTKIVSKDLRMLSSKRNTSYFNFAIKTP